MAAVISFEDYCEERGITEAEKPAAFAAYLHSLSGGTWDGEVSRIESPDE